MPIVQPNSKDVLFKSKVNNYISEKAETTTTFALTDGGNGHYTIGNSNGDVSLSIDEQNETYVFTPTRGDAVSVLASSVSSIAVDFITLNADATTLDDMYITGSGIVNFGSFSTPYPNISYINPAILMADIAGSISGEPFLLYPSMIGNAGVGRIISIASGEVKLDIGHALLNTSIVVQENATFILEASQAEGAAISGEGNSVILGIYGDYSISV
ncbi:MAG: hypothetical protein RBS11_06980, partial [Sulfurimonas sp.]|nr:hypothetical protein [Sulfurimonas sp.]